MQNEQTMTATQFFHLHLVSDSTGETILSAGRAAASQYADLRSIEHLHTMVRTQAEISLIIESIENEPGIVLHSLIEPELANMLEKGCRDLSVPSLSVLDPVFNLFNSHLGAPSARRAGAQHSLDQSYFKRIDALNFSLSHDDGHLPKDLNEADVIIIGISRTSKTPTCIYLANRGIRAANVPLIPEVPLDESLKTAKDALIIGLIASPERIVQIRQHRLLAMNQADSDTAYIDQHAVAEEIAYTRKLCARMGWPVIDVTRRSVEETAAAIYTIFNQHQNSLRV